MAEIYFPHEVVYQVEGPATVAEVVSALLGAEQLLRETAPLLEGCVDGLTIERIQVSVRRFLRKVLCALPSMRLLSSHSKRIWRRPCLP